MDNEQYEIQTKKVKEKAVQQPEIFAQSRPREGNRAVRQADQFAAFEGSQVEKGLRQEAE